MAVVVTVSPTHDFGVRTVARQVVAGSLVLLLVGTLAGFGGGVGLASAGHDPADANATIKPLGDRSPGATEVRYGQTVVATAGIDLDPLTRTLVTYEAGSWVNCGADNPPEVFGIDRGNTHEGYEIDEELMDNVKSFSAGEDELETTYYDENDFGASTHLDDGDQLVSVTECINNPDEPGWYRIEGLTEGVNSPGEQVSYGGYSHYFWICNCENEAEAREQLGPPPSEPEGTPTPSRTGAGDSGDTTGTPAGDDGGTTTPDSSDTTGTHTATRTPEPTPTPSPTRTPPESWDEVVVRTPTASSGPGFSGVAALFVFGGLIYILRRRP